MRNDGQLNGKDGTWELCTKRHGNGGTSSIFAAIVTIVLDMLWASMLKCDDGIFLDANKVLSNSYKCDDGWVGLFCYCVPSKVASLFTPHHPIFVGQSLSLLENSSGARA